MVANGKFSAQPNLYIYTVVIKDPFYYCHKIASDLMQENEAACLKDRRLFLGIKFEFKWTFANLGSIFPQILQSIQSPSFSIQEDNLGDCFTLPFLKEVTKDLFQPQEVAKDNT